MTRSLAVFVASLVSLSGCALAHERPAGPVSDVADYDTVLAHAPAPSDGPGCGASTFRDFALAGMTDVRFPAIAGVDGGFVTTFVHFAPLHDAPIGNDYPTAGARMRGDLSGLLDAPSDDGIVMEQGAFTNRSALAVGDDGRLGTCAVAHDEGDDYHHVPGGVAIFDATGVLLHLTRLEDDCADVAYVAGHWVALETTLEVDSERRLVVLDDTTFEPAVRVGLGVGEPGVAYERVVALRDHAVVLRNTRAGAYLVEVDVDAAAIIRQSDLPLDARLRVTQPEVDLVAREDRLSLVYRASDGTIAWASFDDQLALLHGPVVVDRQTSEYPVIDVTPMQDGIVIAWSRGGLGAPIPLALGVALLDDATGVMTPVDVELPREYAIGARTLDVAVSGDVVAVALHVDDGWRATSSRGIWSARCRAR